MDSPGDSDSSEGMRDLIERGFAIKSGRGHLSPDLDYPGTSRVPVRDTDVSYVQRPLACNMLAGVASTHGLTLSTNESVTVAGRYIYIMSMIDIVCFVLIFHCEVGQLFTNRVAHPPQ